MQAVCLVGHVGWGETERKKEISQIMYVCLCVREGPIVCGVCPSQDLSTLLSNSWQVQSYILAVFEMLHFAIGPAPHGAQHELIFFSSFNWVLCPHWPPLLAAPSVAHFKLDISATTRQQPELCCRLLGTLNPAVHSWLQHCFLPYFLPPASCLYAVPGEIRSSSLWCMRSVL